MLSADDIRAVYDDLDRKTHIDTSYIPIRIFYAPQKTIARCCYTVSRSGVYTPTGFEFNRYFEERMSAAGWHDAYLHEYAHAAVMVLTKHGHGHDAVWQQMCIQLGCRPEPYNYNPIMPEAMRELHTDGPTTSIQCRRCGATYNLAEDSRMVRLLQAGIPAANYVCSCGNMTFRLLPAKRPAMETAGISC